MRESKDNKDSSLKIGWKVFWSGWHLLVGQMFDIMVKLHEKKQY